MNRPPTSTAGSPRSCWLILEDIHRDGRTVVIATHDPRVFDHPIVNRILEMRDGRIVGERRR